MVSGEKTNPLFPTVTVWMLEAAELVALGVAAEEEEEVSSGGLPYWARANGRAPSTSKWNELSILGEFEEVLNQLFLLWHFFSITD